MIGEGPIHVIPLHDVYEHRCSEACACRPDVEQHSVGRTDYLVIHRAWDGRELLEQAIAYIAIDGVQN